MTHQPSPHAVHLRLDAVLTELALYAKALCPEATIHVSAWQHEDADGCVEVFPPAGLSEAEEERLELALCARAADLFAETGLFVPCAVLDATARPTEPVPPLAYSPSLLVLAAYLGTDRFGGTLDSPSRV